MRILLSGLVAISVLSGCDGNPFGDQEPTSGQDGTPTTDAFVHSTELPPGTSNPTASSAIQRREATSESGSDQGNGYVTGFTHNADDTFTVTGLAFDGGNVYQRGAIVDSLNGYAVYEADSSYADPVTGTPIDQFSHRALYGVSNDGTSAFAIVRTGAYVPYGFGGFVYERDNAVTLPTTGQANFEGDYAALRDFNGRGGLEYVDGTMNMSIDFNGFASGPGVRGEVSDRRVFDINGNDVTADILSGMNQNLGADGTLTGLPVLVFAVGGGVMDQNGELAGELNSFYSVSGASTALENGNYYAMVSGAGANQTVTGVIVVTSDDPRYEGVTVRETGGFILYRQ